MIAQAVHGRLLAKPLIIRRNPPVPKIPLPDAAVMTRRQGSMVGGASFAGDNCAIGQNACRSGATTSLLR
jgi:hypothetical protein